MFRGSSHFVVEFLVDSDCDGVVLGRSVFQQCVNADKEGSMFLEPFRTAFCKGESFNRLNGSWSHGWYMIATSHVSDEGAKPIFNF